MSLFICDKCGAIENTSLGYYWIPKKDNKPVLCSECFRGKWHNKFKKEYYKELSEDKKKAYNLINEVKK